MNNRDSVLQTVNDAEVSLEAVSRRAARGEVGEVTLQLARQRVIAAQTALSVFDASQNSTGNLVARLLYSDPEPEPWLQALLKSKGG